MADNIQKAGSPKLKELIKLLTGKWRVTGREIEGEAEFKPANGERTLVSSVDFSVSGAPMKVMQHIAYDQTTDTLQAQYMDTMGDRSVYIWQLDGHTMRVSHDSKDSDTYFEAIFNDEFSEYTGTWHYPAGSSDAEDEKITYTRIE